MLMNRLGLALVLVGAVGIQPLAARADAGRVDINNAVQSSLTLYSDKAFVRHSLSALPSEQGSLQVSGLPREWDHDSLELRYQESAGSVAPAQLIWQPEGLDRDVIYRGMVGKSVELLGGGLNVPVQGTMLSYHSGLALVQGTNGRQYLVDWSDPQGIRVAGRDAMVADNQLVSGITASFTPEQVKQLQADNLQLSYVTPSVRYSSHYRMTVNDSDNARLELSALLNNYSDTSFTRADIRLVSGDTGRRAAYARSRQVMMEAAPAAMDSAGERVGEMLVQKLPEGTRLPARSSQQLSLLRKDALKVEKLYALDVYGRSFSGRNKVAERPRLTYRFKAETDLPAAPVKLFEETTDGAVIIAGESWLTQTTSGDYAHLTMGEALAVRVERNLKSSQQQEKDLKNQWQAVIRNDQDVEVTLTLMERDSGLLKISDVKGATLEGARTLTVKVPAKSSHEISYQATYRL
ncbi:hypothetical protein [Endozoicomonas lisbonensis]|uniref:DUF4139 domain-containing protein n=1 Tax=Endozoicomonas lisbonensis TaxID=3120522 RepID=A0ABV2SNB5_9GAMM